MWPFDYPANWVSGGEKNGDGKWGEIFLLAKLGLSLARWNFVFGANCDVHLASNHIEGQKRHKFEVCMVVIKWTQISASDIPRLNVNTKIKMHKNGGMSDV